MSKEACQKVIKRVADQHRKLGKRVDVDKIEKKVIRIANEADKRNARNNP